MADSLLNRRNCNGVKQLYSNKSKQRKNNIMKIGFKNFQPRRSWALIVIQISRNISYLLAIFKSLDREEEYGQKFQNQILVLSSSRRIFPSSFLSRYVFNSSVDQLQELSGRLKGKAGGEQVFQREQDTNGRTWFDRKYFQGIRLKKKFPISWKEVGLE